MPDAATRITTRSECSRLGFSLGLSAMFELKAGTSGRASSTDSFIGCSLHCGTSLLNSCVKETVESTMSYRLSKRLAHTRTQNHTHTHHPAHMIIHRCMNILFEMRAGLTEDLFNFTCLCFDLYTIVITILSTLLESNQRYACACIVTLTNS